MTDYRDQLKEIIQSKLSADGKVVVYLEAGHYDPRLSPDSFSLESLKDALAVLQGLIATYKGEVKIVLGILVDDLGLECGSGGCSIKEAQNAHSEEDDSLFPQSIEEVLSSSRFVKRERVLRFSERTTKNRAIQTLRNGIKSEKDSIQVEEGDRASRVIFHSLEEDPVLLAEFEGSVYRAKCPSIMGQHYSDCFMRIKQRFTEMTSLIIVDWSEMMDHSKVTMGSQAAFKVFFSEEAASAVTLMNIFFQDAAGVNAEYEVYREEEFESFAIPVPGVI